MPQFPLPLCVLRPHFLQLSVRVFLPVSHQQNPVSPRSPIIMLTGWRWEQGALPARGGQPAMPPRTSPGRAEQRGLASGCQHSYVEMTDAPAIAAQVDAQGNVLSPLKRQCNVPERLGKDEVRETLLSLCPPSASFSSVAFHREVVEITGIPDYGQKVLEIMGAPACGQRLGHPGMKTTQSQRAFDYEQNTQHQAVPSPEGPKLLRENPR